MGTSRCVMVYLRKMQLDQGIQEQLRKFFAAYPVKRAYVFGSFSRGDARADSDLDLLVDLDRTKPFGLGFIDMQLKLEDLLGRKVDVVTRRALSKYIEPYVLKDLKLIYARDEA